MKKEEDWNQSDDILPSNQQLGEIHTPPFKEEPSEDKENENQDSDVLQVCLLSVVSDSHTIVKPVFSES